MTCDEDAIFLSVGRSLDFLETCLCVRSLSQFFSHFWVLWFLLLSWRFLFVKTSLDFNPLAGMWSEDCSSLRWAALCLCCTLWCRRILAWCGSVYLLPHLLCVYLLSHPRAAVLFLCSSACCLFLCILENKLTPFVEETPFHMLSLSILIEGLLNKCVCFLSSLYSCTGLCTT